MESEIVYTGEIYVELLQNNYDSGDILMVKYRHGATEAACLLASWDVYSNPFVSSGYVQIRIEAE
jgi:hypothetical protein